MVSIDVMVSIDGRVSNLFQKKFIKKKISSHDNNSISSKIYLP